MSKKIISVGGYISYSMVIPGGYKIWKKSYLDRSK